MISAKLDAVAKSKQAYMVARATLEARLREQMKDDLKNLQTQVDIAVRYAVDAGESKAAVLRALGTKNFDTIKASLERTHGVAEVVGADPLEGIYHLDEIGEKQMLYVNYVNHGPDKFNGEGRFDMQTFDDGRLFFTAREPLWNEDYTVRNDAVAVLDGKTDGYYYEEVRDWLAL
jgi:hypothetical protein